MVPFGQGFVSMSNPTKDLMRLTLEGKLAHGGHPVLRWCMDNVVVKTDPAGNIKIDKAKATEKVDLSVALVMALDRGSAMKRDRTRCMKGEVCCFFKARKNPCFDGSLQLRPDKQWSFASQS